MPWHIGIDEAGYGPNLGPLLQTAVGIRHPADGLDLWQSLGAAVRKCSAGRDPRLMIDDSKKVYGTAQGLKNLEIGVLALLCPAECSCPLPLAQFLERVAPEAILELRAEPWFVEAETLPIAVHPARVMDAINRFHAAREAAALPGFWVRSRITPPALFNSLLEERGNKADVLAHGLRWLIQIARRSDDGPDAVVFAIDRQGGRLYHTALLETACPDGRVEVIDENELKCNYRMRAERELRWSFEVAAESQHFTVALASMVSKYLREVLMAQFNRFWQAHLPGLKATAGYPSDASRFYAQIRPLMANLQIAEHLVWRRK